MATAITIKRNIAKLEAALKSKATPKSLRSKLETQLVKSKAELSALNKGSKPKTSSTNSTKTTLQKLKSMVNKDKKYKNYKGAGVDLEKDADRPALRIGKRTAKKSGKTYYEYRANRIDVKQPSKTARYPKLEQGGYMAKGGKVKFYDIVDELIDYDVQYDGDPTDLRLFSELRYSWGADNEKDYEKAQSEIDKIKYEGKGWEVYASYDTSSYNYWMKQQEEQNYINIAILFDEDTIDESEVEKLKEALSKAISKAEDISLKYDYDPQGDNEEYKKGGYMAKGGSIRGGKFNVGDKVMIDDSGYNTSFYGFDLSQPATITNKNKVKTSRGIVYTYNVEFADGKKPFNSALENKLTLVDSKMAKGGVIGDSVIVELNSGKKIEGKIEKLNPFKIRTSPSSTEVIPNSYMKSVKKMADGGYMAKGGEVTEKEVVESNAQMVLSNIKEVKHHADELSNVVSKKSNIEAWVVAKIERASTDLSDITHYLEGQHNKMAMGGEIHRTQE
jgi:hypothetical protein